MADDTNRRVAEKVMGGKVVPWGGEELLALNLRPLGEFHVIVDGKRFSELREMPSFLLDPAAVFGPGGVVDTILSRGFNFTLRRGVDGQNQATFQGARTVAFSAQSSRQLMAVNLAALEAVEESNNV